MQSYAVSSLVGGATPGSHFPDVFYMADGGRVVLNDAANSILNTTHPIHQIAVSTYWVIDGVSVTYNLEGGNTTAMNHGSSFDPPSAVVDFGENEVLAAVYGRAGYYSYYERTLVGSIAFVIFDTKTEESRTAGPYGDADGAVQGQPFWASDVLALGSFGQDSSSLGLSGLVFFKNPSNESIGTTLMPASNTTN
ncbi:hypothetical protein V8D89_013864 [Ganoderma adspersum]